MHHLSSADLHQLEQQSRGFKGKHVRFLSDALHHLRQDGSVLDTLALLSKMQGSAHADRREEADALHDVGTWLERYLHGEREPVQAESLALRLAWLRRLARINDKAATSDGTPGSRDDQRGGGRATSRAGERVAVRRFGDRLEEFRRRYASYQARAVTQAPIVDHHAAAAEGEAKRRRDITELIDRLKPGDTDGVLSKILDLAHASELEGVARQCEEKLGKKIVRKAINDNKPWIRRLAQILQPGTETS